MHPARMSEEPTGASLAGWSDDSTRMMMTMLLQLQRVQVMREMQTLVGTQRGVQSRPGEEDVMHCVAGPCRSVHWLTREGASGRWCCAPV